MVLRMSMVGDVSIVQVFDSDEIKIFDCRSIAAKWLVIFIYFQSSKLISCFTAKKGSLVLAQSFICRPIPRKQYRNILLKLLES